MTELAIVESRADPASVHICDHLRERLEWDEREDDERPDADGGGLYYRADGIELRSFDAFHLDLEHPVEAFDCDPDLLVFASRHSGETGPLLTGHFTGNLGSAEYGGRDHAVAAAAPNALGALLEAFDEHAPEGYDVGMECTHHGPTDVGCPSLFAELGRDEPQWEDPDGAAAVARAILDLRNVAPHGERTVVGVGGNHYAPRFERIVRETPWAVGHVASDWALEDLGHPGAHEDVLEAMVASSGTDLAVVDGEWPIVAETLADLGYRVVSETWLREVGDRPLEVVETVESTLGRIDDGVRFGEHETSAIAVHDLPGELVETAEGIDADPVRDAVAAHSVAYETDNGGSRVGTRAALPVDADDSPSRHYEAIVEGLAAVLEASYRTVTIEDDRVVAETTAFDPALAREAGVPEGPAFGRLADGEAVTVDGTEVEPSAVHTTRTDVFDI